MAEELSETQEQQPETKPRKKYKANGGQSAKRSALRKLAKRGATLGDWNARWFGFTR